MTILEGVFISDLTLSLPIDWLILIILPIIYFIARQNLLVKTDITLFVNGFAVVFCSIHPQITESLYVKMEREVVGKFESTDQKHIMRYQQMFAAMIIRNKLSEGGYFRCCLAHAGQRKNCAFLLSGEYLFGFLFLKEQSR